MAFTYKKEKKSLNFMLFFMRTAVYPDFLYNFVQ